MLNFLEDDKKPHLQIISNKKEDFNKVKSLSYPFIEYILIYKKLPIWCKLINKVTIYTLKRPIFSTTNHLKKIEILFPSSFDNHFSCIKNKVFWIPDFQEHFLPKFFSESEIIARKEYQKNIASQKFIIFSSKDAQNSFSSFYPESTIKKYVFNFVSILPNNFPKVLDDVLKKYNLTNQKYFFSPNQFWEHKNHIIILKAIKKLKDQKKLDFQVYFSGKEYDYRNPTYFTTLENFVSQNQLNENIKFLGFIDRSDQICLMNYAIGIIQPSLFEGWSSVVEDAKALNQHIIVSNLAVHKEQLLEKAYYFNPKDEDSLIEQLEFVNRIVNRKIDFNYDHIIKESANNFIEIMKDVKTIVNTNKKLT